MTDAQPNPSEPPSVPLAPLTFDDVEGRSYRDLSFERKDPTVRDSLEEICLMCGGVGRWSTHYADAVFVQAPGHRIESLEGESLIVLDSCGNHLVT